MQRRDLEAHRLQRDAVVLQRRQGLLLGLLAELLTVALERRGQRAGSSFSLPSALAPDWATVIICAAVSASPLRLARLPSIWASSALAVEMPRDDGIEACLVALQSLAGDLQLAAIFSSSSLAAR